VDNGISKRVCRQISQEVCPWNQRFARVLPEDSPFAPREFLRGKDASQLARDLLAMSQEEFSAAFKGSPMKRAKLRGFKRNAAVVLGNVGTGEDVPALESALDDPEPLVHAHAAWALTKLGSIRNSPCEAEETTAPARVPD
jgi:epoxyqueuosine reductase